MTESMEAHRNNNGSVRMKEKWHRKNNNEMRDQWDKRSKEASKDMGWTNKMVWESIHRLDRSR